MPQMRGKNPHAATDAWNWTSQAATDAWNWTSQATTDAWNWTSQAATDAWNWTSQAATDAWNWTSQAATDAWNFVVTNSKSIINSFEMAFSGVTTGVEVYSYIKNIPLPPKYEIVVWTVDISLWVCDMVKHLIGE